MRWRKMFWVSVKYLYHDSRVHLCYKAKPNSGDGKHNKFVHMSPRWGDFTACERSMKGLAPRARLSTPPRTASGRPSLGESSQRSS
ncbi:MAG: hypothetical protein LZF62_480296 [Nitrospira sp.]|nr:MAG: hypothetical protein LZF62_480296 [Nitrospira sp.]